MAPGSGLQSPMARPSSRRPICRPSRRRAAAASAAAREASLGWLVARYQASSAWSSLAKSTQRQRINILNRVLAGAGDMLYREVTRALIIGGRERRAKTPPRPNNFLNTMRAVFKWAVEQEFLDGGPTEGVKIVKRPKTGGFKEAIEDDIAKFEARWPKGTREYLALTLFLETGCGGATVIVGTGTPRAPKIEIRTAGRRLVESRSRRSSARRSRRRRLGSRIHRQVGRRATHEGRPWKLDARRVQGGWRSVLRTWAPKGRGRSPRRYGAHRSRARAGYGLGARVGHGASYTRGGGRRAMAERVADKMNAKREHSPPNLCGRLGETTKNLNEINTLFSVLARSRGLEPSLRSRTTP